MQGVYACSAPAPSRRLVVSWAGPWLARPWRLGEARKRRTSLPARRWSWVSWPNLISDGLGRRAEPILKIADAVVTQCVVNGSVHGIVGQVLVSALHDGLEYVRPGQLDS